MTPAQIEQRKEWARRWQKAGSWLEEITRAELAAMNETQRLAAADSLTRIGYQFRQPRDTSGLIEQQRAYHKCPNPTRFIKPPGKFSRSSQSKDGEAA
jgi:hypothetical protein